MLTCLFSLTTSTEQVQPVRLKVQLREGSNFETARFFVLTYAGMAEKWRRNKRDIALSDVIAVYDVFKGEHTMNNVRPSDEELLKAFNTTNREEVMIRILEVGEILGEWYGAKKAGGAD